VIGTLNVLIESDLITPQLLGSDTLRLLRTIICPSQMGKHLFKNIYYLPVEKGIYKYTYRDVHFKPRYTYRVFR